MNLKDILASHKDWLTGNGVRADLQGADLRYADLQGANLRYTNLQGADLRYTNLQGADLQGADLQGAILQGADLRYADLQGANLQGTKNLSEVIAAQLVIVPEGNLIVWKKCADNVLVKLRIPEDARRSNATGRKCRAEFADVLKIVGGEIARSLYQSSFLYKVGERAKCNTWEEDRWIECGGGIHFFLTRKEAEDYDY